MTLNGTPSRISTGTPGLDSVLGGGLPRDHVYLLCGPSGAGKTTAALQFLLDGARRDERCLYIGTSESVEDIEEVCRSHGWDPSHLTLRHVTGSAGDGRPQTMLHPIEVELPQAMERLLKLIDEVDPQRLVIDSLTEIRLLSREVNWFRDQLEALFARLSRMPCTALLTDLVTESQTALRSAVHGVIELEQTPRPYGPDRRCLRVAKMRGIEFFSGFHDIAIETGGVRVFPRLVAAAQPRIRESGTISSGIDGLDELTGGALDRGTATLVLGPTGTGKSSLATQYAVAAATRGEKTAMYVFDERAHTLFLRAEGWGLELQKHVDAGLIQIRQVDPLELTPGQFSQAVVGAVEDGASIVVIDSLDGYAYAMPEERLLGPHLHELLSSLSQRGVTSIHTMTRSGFFGRHHTSLDVSYVADTIILLQRRRSPTSNSLTISVHKRRTGPHPHAVHELVLGPRGIEIGGTVRNSGAHVAADILDAPADQHEGGP